MTFSQTGHLDCADLNELATGEIRDPHDRQMKLDHIVGCEACQSLCGDEYPDVQEMVERSIVTPAE